ncbi:hypothetical protein GH714_025612 [Hevea brasiliensis]|uniref:Pentacotripeptide-repeat region of PRORP domain-containing protein n=2 Tax=Hevea brasiliensis TaxID=3981 RepID=A0A6A6KJU7_HEVBR|nr:hypothetical protein GH714_025612 [Hevea brasiliensis]
MSIASAPYILSMANKFVLNSRQKSESRKPDPAISLLQICKKVEELAQVHALLVKTSLIREKHAFGSLLLSFASVDNLGTLDYAQKLFDTIDIPRNSFMYNTMIRAYVNCGNPREAFVVYSKMVREDSAQASSCSDDKMPCQVWASFLEFLDGFYMKIGEIGIVIHRLFDRIENPDIVSWNCLIDGYAKSGNLGQARRVFDEMPQRDVVSWTIMLVGYINAGLLSEAAYLFNEMPERNLVSWTALVNGYLKMGYYGKALDLFKEMQIAEVEMDEITITTLISACAKLGALDQGRWLHTYLDKSGIKADAQLSTALIDMYSKCGRIDLARKVFKETEDKKVFVWNSMLGGLAMHSFGEEAIELFDKMIECGIEPNEITYISILAACNHSGLVDVGLYLFNRLVEDQKVQPKIEHYGCLVDLLGRAGLLDDAFQVVKTMPLKADGTIWRALLGACKLHGNVKLADQVGRILIKLEPHNHMNYVLLSNVYAMVNRWEIVGELRREMKVKGLTKMPGCSMIELNGVVHEFVARDSSHPRSRDVYELLNLMTNHVMQESMDCQRPCQ